MDKYLNEKVYYKTFGENTNESIIFLHGWGQDNSTFKHLYEKLEQENYIIAIDLPGFGKSEEPKEVWDISKYVEILEAIIKKEQLTNPVIIAHSFGGRIALKYASKETNISKLILISSAGIKPKRKLTYYYKVYKYKIVKKILETVKKQSLIEKYRQKKGSSDYKNASPMMRQILVKAVNEDLTEISKNITAPTLLIWGEDDDVTPLRQAKILEKNIKDAGLITIENCGHFSYLQVPQQLLIIINCFIKNKY